MSRLPVTSVPFTAIRLRWMAAAGGGAHHGAAVVDERADAPRSAEHGQERVRDGDHAEDVGLVGAAENVARLVATRACRSWDRTGTCAAPGRSSR